MVDINKAHEISEGLQITDGPFITGGSASPVGLSLPQSTVYIQQTSMGIEFWKKFDAGNNDWAKIFGAVFAASPPPTVLNHNGTLSGGQLIGYSNLVNNAFVVGFRSILSRVTFNNANTSADFAMRFYKNSESPANLFYTWTVSNPSNGIAVATISNSPIFEVGDTLPIYYDDQGSNASDVNLGLFMEAVPS